MAQTSVLMDHAARRSFARNSTPPAEGKPTMTTKQLKHSLLAGLALLAVAQFSGASQAAVVQCRTLTPIQATTATYTPDRVGIIDNAAPNDILALVQAGCQQLGVKSGLIGRLLNANMNSTADQAISLWQGQAFRVTKITVTSATAALTTAAGGIYTGGSKTGTALVAASQVYSALSAGNIALEPTIDATGGALFFGAAQGLYLSLTTAQGAAATADIFIYGDVGL
jgi:CubicO group peptidase (beta-lactamase class C family)